MSTPYPRQRGIAFIYFCFNLDYYSLLINYNKEEKNCKLCPPLAGAGGGYQQVLV